MDLPQPLQHTRILQVRISWNFKPNIKSMSLNSIKSCNLYSYHSEAIEKDNKLPNTAPTGKAFSHPYNNPHNPVNFSGVFILVIRLNHLNCFSTSLDQNKCPHIMRISLLLENIYSSLMVVWLLLDLLQVQQIYIGLPNHHSYRSYFGCKLCTSTWRVVSHSWSPFWLDFTEELPAMNVSNLINIIMKTCNSRLDPYLKQLKDKLNMDNCTKNIEMLSLN